MEVFIPELKKQYTIARDWHILLYPFNGMPQWVYGQSKYDYIQLDEEHPIYTTTLYAESKANLQVITDVKCIKFIDNKSFWQQDSHKVYDYFLVTDKDFAFVEHLINSPFDLMGLDNDDNIYLIVSDPIHRVNVEFKLFCAEEFKRNYDWYPNKAERNYWNSIKTISRFAHSVDERFKVYEDCKLEIIDYYNKVLASAIKLNPLFDPAVKNYRYYVPINYTIKSGNSIKIKKLGVKPTGRSKSKVQYAEIEIGEFSLIVLMSDINNLILV